MFMKIMTYNILNDHPKFPRDSAKHWANRASHLIEHIQLHQPDILAIQEGKANQVEVLQKATGLAYYGVFAGGRYGGEQAGVFYNDNLYELLESNTFWLSPTPEEASIGWGAGHNRICSYIVLKIRATGQVYIHFNTHLDAASKMARLEGIKLILSRMKAMRERYLTAYFVLTGDLNSGTHTATYKLLTKQKYLEDSFKHAMNKHQLRYTYGGIDKAWTWNKLLLHIFYPNYMHQRIDHVFVSPNIVVLNYEISDWSYKSYYPSDHFPVIIDIDL